MSHRALSPQQFTHLYHESPIQARESIRQEGLKPGEGWRKYENPEEFHAPPGVYLSPHGVSEYSSSMAQAGRLKGYGTASHYGFDRWRVDVRGLDVQTDPTQTSSAHYLPHGIPPERLRLVAKADPNYEKNI